MMGLYLGLLLLIFSCYLYVLYDTAKDRKIEELKRNEQNKDEF